MVDGFNKRHINSIFNNAQITRYGGLQSAVEAESQMDGEEFLEAVAAVAAYKVNSVKLLHCAPQV